MQNDNYVTINSNIDAKHLASANKIAHRWEDKITHQVLQPQRYLDKKHKDNMQKQRIDLDMHVKMRSQRKILDSYDAVDSNANAQSVATSIQNAKK